MNIIYLSPDYSDYVGALYQQDVIEKLDQIHTMDFYGPGHAGYNSEDTITDIISKVNIEPDIICLGHGWLFDRQQKPIERMPEFDLSTLDIPTVLILNKEYTSLEKKLDYADRQNIDIVFSHHHRAPQWDEERKSKYVYWPFAVNHNRFKDYSLEFEYDLAFSGILRNPNPRIAKTQSDYRIKVQNQLYHTIGNLKIKKKNEYSDYNIFWRAKPPTRAAKIMNRILHREKRLPTKDYHRLYNKSKITLNTLSPVDLVGTRYFEAMASKSLVLCEHSSIYSNHGLFEPENHCVTFSDIDEFVEKFRYYADNDADRREIAESGYKHVLENHTWECRINTMTNIIRSYIQ